MNEDVETLPLDELRSVVGGKMDGWTGRSNLPTQRDETEKTSFGSSITSGIEAATNMSGLCLGN
jgi:hypothetical protein